MTEVADNGDDVVDPPPSMSIDLLVEEYLLLLLLLLLWLTIDGDEDVLLFMLRGTLLDWLFVLKLIKPDDFESWFKWSLF